MFSSLKLEKGIAFSPTWQILFRDLFYSRLHPRELILKIPLVALQHLLLLFRGRMMMAVRHTASTIEMVTHG
jgi:hypothetical protein